MDAKDIRNLQEAYMGVYSHQEEVEIDEAVKGADPEMRKVASSERRGGDKRLPPSKGKGYAAHAMQQAAYMDKKTKGKHIPGYAFPEEVDVYDIILSHLLDEGYAETPEAAQVIMVNMSEEWREEIMEGMTLKDFKANRQKNKRRAASADAEKRGHVGKEWYNSGRKYSPDEAKRSRANMSNDERRARHSTAVDPDNEDHNEYSADKTKNAKKLRKQRAMGEH